MHVIAARDHRPTEDPIFTLALEAKARIERGESIVNATIGAAMNDAGKLAVLPTAAKALRDVSDADLAAYAPIPGRTDFLNAVKKDLLATVPPLLDAAVAIATPGGSGALRAAIQNFLEPGQALLTTNYYWAPYLTLADDAERRVETFSMFAEDGSFDVADLDRAVGDQLAKQGRVLLFLNDPCHNPTGYSMKREEWRRVIEALVAHADKGPITLLVDTAYLEYSAGDARAFLPELVPALGKLAVLFAWSASKTFTLYGARIGALIACLGDATERRATEAALAYSCRGTWSNCNHAGLVAVRKLLEDPELIASVNTEREVLKKTLLERVNAFNELARANGLRYPRYEGGFFVTVFHEDSFAHAKALRDVGVFVVPQKGTLRVALCAVPAAEIPRLVHALATGGVGQE
jgi:aromatic-amino-acid transaminase